MKKKILIIGSNSFIASNLIDHLKKEAEVVGVYHSNKERLFSDIKNISINDLYTLDTDFEEVYLLSAFIPGAQPTESDRKKMFEVNVELVEFICQKFKKSRIVYSSTVSVFSPKDDEIYERGNEGGINEYGISKLWGEKIVQKSEHFSIVRFSSVYGIGMKFNTIIPNYIRQALENKVITIWGEGKRRQDYIHVSDAINFLKKAALIKENDIFLATTSRSISNFELARIISQKTGCDISFEKKDISPSFFYDNTYTVKKLQYSASVSMDHGITELIEWVRKKY